MHKKASLKTGLSPDLIGELVVIQMFRKKGGEVLEDTKEKFVGILKSYHVSAQAGGSFVIDGFSPREIEPSVKSHFEIFLLEDSRHE